MYYSIVQPPAVPVPTTTPAPITCPSTDEQTYDINGLGVIFGDVTVNGVVTTDSNNVWSE